MLMRLTAVNSRSSTSRSDLLKLPILVPRAHDPSGLVQGSRALVGPDFLSMRRAFVSYSRQIRFDGKNTRSKRLRMRKVSIFKIAVANANFTTRTPLFELKSNFISIQNFKAGNFKPPGMHWSKDF